MKKASILILSLFLVINAKAQLPEYWDDDDGIGVYQESTNVFNGNHSAGIIVNSTDQNLCDFINTSEIPVTPGETFRISFYGFTSQNVRARAFFYWVGATRTNSTNYLGPNTGGWQQFEFEATVPANATGVNLGIRFYAIPGFMPGEIQRLDDVVFESPVDNPLTVANGDFEIWSSILPEPDHYPNNFSTAATGFNAILTWTDPQEGQLPEHYLIKVSTNNNVSLPDDGSFVPDDLNLTDGNGAVNVPYGKQTFTFTGLQSLTDYYFSIFPYTNTGANIDYKTDGTPPSTQIQTAEVTILETENFDASWGNWNPVNVFGNEAWSRSNNFGINNTPCARMTGVNSGNVFANEDWLISPALDFTNSENEVLTFFSAVGFSAAERQLTVKISTDYNGEDNPNEATWTALEATFPDGALNFVWTFSGVVDVSEYESDNIHIAFVYACDNTEAATWQIDNITITGEGVEIILPKPTDYPAGFTAMASGTTINLSWTDANGLVVPTGYLILATDQEMITPPVYGVPVENDPELADGFGALNILPGVETATFDNLLLGQTYYFEIFPYTNSGVLINYKTDETPPSANVSIPASIELFFTGFNNSWNGWTPISLFGEQIWSRNNNTGINNSPCASIRGFAEIPLKNEDWLISPPFTFDETLNHRINFFSSRNYEGADLKFLVSTTYNGADNPNNFEWTDLSPLATWPVENEIWTNSGEIDLTPFTGSTFYVAFVYFSSTLQAAKWQIDDIQILASAVKDAPTNYPENFSVAGGQRLVTATWTDATGNVVPDGYLLLISENQEIALPQDGFPVENDADISDGLGAANIQPGTESHTFAQLKNNTPYYLQLVPFTNAGALIRYKTDGILPETMAVTLAGFDDLLFTTFNQSWENWLRIAIEGGQTWQRENMLGINNSPAASIQNFNGSHELIQNWLISPPIDLSGTSSQTLDFYTTKVFNGGAVKVMVSDDYDGSGLPVDFIWIDFTDSAILPIADQFEEWIWSEEIDISQFDEKIIYIAFKFEANIDESAQWMIDDIRVQAQVTNIEETKSLPLFRVFPNPGRGMFHYNAAVQGGTLTIFNTLGFVAYQKHLSEQSGTVDLTQLPKGLYIFIFNDRSGNVITQKVIIH